MQHIYHRHCDTRTQVCTLLELGVNDRRQQWNHATTKMLFPSPPMYTCACVNSWNLALSPLLPLWAWKWVYSMIISCGFKFHDFVPTYNYPSFLALLTNDSMLVGVSMTMYNLYWHVSGHHGIYRDAWVTLAIVGHLPCKILGYAPCLSRGESLFIVRL